jgi:hypothetical protein
MKGSHLKWTQRLLKYVVHLERLDSGRVNYQSEDLKSIEIPSGGYLPFAAFVKLANPIAKCVSRCRAAGGGPPQETLGILSIANNN